MINKKNKLILFDWGNIVESVTTGYTIINAWNDLFRKCGYKGNDDVTKKVSSYRLSRITKLSDLKKAYLKIAKDFNLNTSFEEYVNHYKRIFDKIDYYEDVANFEHSLKDKCYIGIMSNLTILDEERLNKEVNLSCYDHVFLSFKFGLRKPEELFYKKIEELTSFKPNEILLIDDKLENVKTAKRLGWNAYQSTGLKLEKIKKVCDKFLSK